MTTAIANTAQEHDFGKALLYRAVPVYEEFYFRGDGTTDSVVVLVDNIETEYLAYIQATRLVVDGREWHPKTAKSLAAGIYRYEWEQNAHGLYTKIKPSLPGQTDYREGWPPDAECVFYFIPALR